MLYMAKLWGYELLEKFKFHLESGKIEKKDHWIKTVVIKMNLVL